jgi:hypothetical protein
MTALLERLGMVGEGRHGIDILSLMWGGLSRRDLASMRENRRCDRLNPKNRSKLRTR